MQHTLNRYQTRLLLVAALASATFAVTPRAAADHNSFSIGTGIAALVAFPTIGIPGIVTAIHNGVNRNELTAGWKTAGAVFGALNVAAGIILPITGSLGSGSCAGDCRSWNLAWSIPPLLNGALNLTFAFIGKSPSVDTRVGKLSLVPVTGVGAQNKAFGGLGLQLASF